MTKDNKNKPAKADQEQPQGAVIRTNVSNLAETAKLKRGSGDLQTSLDRRSTGSKVGRADANETPAEELDVEALRAELQLHTIGYDSQGKLVSVPADRARSTDGLRIDRNV